MALLGHRLHGNGPQWHDNVEFVEIESGHYPMQETPVMLQTLMEGFMGRHAEKIEPPTPPAEA